MEARSATGDGTSVGTSVTSTNGKETNAMESRALYEN